MTTFKDGVWEDRIKSMGDLAEGEFEKRHKNWERSGWDRPEFNMGFMPERLRFMPDYVMDYGQRPVWVEVQGCGADQLFKFKTNKMEALKWWQAISEMKVYLWLWDDVNKRAFWLSIDEMWGSYLLKPLKVGGSLDWFPEGTEYTKFPAETFPLEP